MKTIFFVATNRFIFTNIINTDVFKDFSKNPNVRIILLVPDYKKDFFVQHVAATNIIIEGINVSRILSTGWSRFFHDLAQPMISGFAANWRIDEHLHKKQYRAYSLAKILNILFRNFPFGQRLFRVIDNFLTPYGFLRPYAKRYKPEFIIATDIFNQCDAFLLMEAHTLGIKTYGMVRSWDNATTKGLLRFIPERILVSSPYIKYELIQYHNVKKDIIDIGGYPQYDTFVNNKKLSREEFCSKFDIDPAKKIILFAPAGVAFHNIDWQILEQLKKMLDNNILPANLHFIIRMHPLSQVDLSQFVPDPRFTIDVPGVHFKINPKASEMVSQDVDHLINSMYHSDIVMYGVSSLCLDATMFLKPQIMIAIDGWHKKPYLESVRRYQDEEHMIYFRKTEAVRVVNSWDSLAEAINNYIKNPDQDKEGRERAYREILLNPHGNFGHAYARLLKQYIQEI